MLQEAGAKVIEVPTIRFEVARGGELDARAVASDTYDDIVFTSQTAVASFADALERVGASATSLRARIAVSGTATARVAGERGFRVSVVPDRFVAEGLVDALLSEPIAGRRVLFPRAEEARDVLPDALIEAGAKVDIVTAYAAVADDEGRAVLLARTDEVDVVTVASSKTMVFFDALLDEASRARYRDKAFASIGPITSKTIRDLGYRVAVEAGESTIDRLLADLIFWFNSSA